MAISPETPDNSLSTKEKNDLEFEVLSDAGNHVAKSLGLVFSLPAALQDLYRQFGIDLESRNGDSSHELPVAATFIIGRNGTIVDRFVDADYRNRMNPEAIVESLKHIGSLR